MEEIKITRAAKLKEKPDASTELGFGKIRDRPYVRRGL